MAKTKYSYLYNGQVVRNSNRLYKYGLVNKDDVVIACSSTEKGALKDKVYYTNFYKRGLEHCNKLLAKGETVNKIVGDLKEHKADLEKSIDNVSKWHVV